MTTDRQAIAQAVLSARTLMRRGMKVSGSTRERLEYAVVLLLRPDYQIDRYRPPPHWDELGPAAREAVYQAALKVKR